MAASAPVRTAPEPATRSPPATTWVVPLLVLVAGMFMSVLDVTIVNVAIPSIQRELGTTLENVLWIATAYTLTLGVVVPLSSWLGDRLGLSRVYKLALFGFALFSAFCGLAWNLETLVVFRVLQAVPGGILPVITMTMVYRIVPREKIGAAMGIFGLGIIFAPAAGPVLGGYLVEHGNWRLIFFVNVPVGILGLLAARKYLPDSGLGPRRPFDLLGFVTIAAGLSAILLASAEGVDWGWTSYRILILFTVGFLSLALFVVIELEIEHPLLDVRVLANRAFASSLVLLSVLTIGLFAVLFYVTVFLQQAQGLTALDAGLRLLPQALVVGALMPIAGRLYDKIGPRWLVVSGMAISAYGAYLLAGINPDMTAGEIITWTCVRSAGMGLAMMPIMTSGIAALPPDKINEGSALNNVARQVIAAISLAAFAALAAGQQAQLMAGRSDLLTANDLTQRGLTPGPHGVALPTMYGLFQQTRLDVLATSYDQIFLVTAAFSLIGAVLALGLRSGPVGAAPPATATAGSAAAESAGAGATAPVSAESVAAESPEPVDADHAPAPISHPELAPSSTSNGTPANGESTLAGVRART